jgi:hypothetical protein
MNVIIKVSKKHSGKLKTEIMSLVNLVNHKTDPYDKNFIICEGSYEDENIKDLIIKAGMLHSSILINDIKIRTDYSLLKFIYCKYKNTCTGTCHHIKSNLNNVLCEIGILNIKFSDSHTFNNGFRDYIKYNLIKKHPNMILYFDNFKVTLSKKELLDSVIKEINLNYDTCSILCEKADINSILYKLNSMPDNIDINFNYDHISAIPFLEQEINLHILANLVTNKIAIKLTDLLNK